MVSKIGNVEDIDGGFRAHVQYHDDDRVKKHIYGPRWPNAAEAQKDLEALRTAAAPFPDNPEQARKAMRTEAERLQLRAHHARVQSFAFATMGEVEKLDDGFRARLRGTEDGDKHDIRGPRRTDAAAAQQDLEAIVTSGSGLSAKAPQHWTFCVMCEAVGR